MTLGEIDNAREGEAALRGSLGAVSCHCWVDSQAEWRDMLQQSGLSGEECVRHVAGEEARLAGRAIRC